MRNLKQTLYLEITLYWVTGGGASVAVPLSKKIDFLLKYIFASNTLWHPIYWYPVNFGYLSRLYLFGCVFIMVIPRHFYLCHLSIDCFNTWIWFFDLIHIKFLVKLVQELYHILLYRFQVSVLYLINNIIPSRPPACPDACHFPDVSLSQIWYRPDVLEVRRVQMLR